MARADSLPAHRRHVRRDEPGYPARVLDLDDAPESLVVAGAWPAGSPVVAIVGARAATPYGLAVAMRLAGDLVRLGAVIVSGLAHGIDAAAHRGALAAGGATVAMLPCGHDRITPPAHVPLAARIARDGAVVSEYAPGIAAHKGMFLARNRLIAACADAVVVVEAREKSGALNTATHARRIGRPLLAVPGDVDRPASRGCHALLRAGARLCEGPADVLAAIAHAVPPLAAAGASASAAAHAAGSIAVHAHAPKVASPAPVPVRLLAALETPATLEACARAAGVSVAEAQAALVELEWSGLVRLAPGARWTRTR